MLGSGWVLGVGELIQTDRFAGNAGQLRQEPWVTKGDLAACLSVSVRTVDRWVCEGLPAAAWRYVGGRKRFRYSEVLLWLDSR